jgi:hypothetical protein
MLATASMCRVSVPAPRTLHSVEMRWARLGGAEGADGGVRSGESGGWFRRERCEAREEGTVLPVIQNTGISCGNKRTKK